MIANNAASLLPGRNPTGGPAYGEAGFVPGAGTSSGANPLLLPPNLPANAPKANPYDVSAVPAFSADVGAYPSSLNLGAGGKSPVSGIGDITGRQQQRTLGELQDFYGEGLGALMYQFLQGGAGYNQQAINNLLASLQPGIERGTESLLHQFSLGGNRFSSGAQIGLADYLSQVNLNEGQLIAQMYEQAIDRYMRTLTGISTESLTKKMSEPSLLDKIGEGVGIAMAPFTGGLSLSGLFKHKGGGGGGGSYMPGDIFGEPSGDLPLGGGGLYDFGMLG